VFIGILRFLDGKGADDALDFISILRRISSFPELEGNTLLVLDGCALQERDISGIVECDLLNNSRRST
jgi:hypothetical protein